jgi:hypothetical protein
MSTAKKKGSIINGLTFGRRPKSSTVEVDIGGPPVAERVSLSTGRGDVLTLVPAVLRTGVVEVQTFFFPWRRSLNAWTYR